MKKKGGKTALSANDLGGGMWGDLEKNFDYYLANLDDLAKKYDGKFIALKDCKVIGAYETMIEAVELSEKQGHELGTFIVQKASTDPSAYTATYFNNLIRIGD